MNPPRPLQGHEDTELIGRLVARDEQALAELYDRYGAGMYSVAAAVVGPGADAEDAVARAFSQVWERPASYQPERAEVAAWLRTIARSRALDIVRAAGRRHERHRNAAESVSKGWQPPGPEDTALARELSTRVHQALGELPEEQRSALELAYFEGLTQVQIAERLETPLGTVKTRVRTGMNKLRGALAAYAGWKER